MGCRIVTFDNRPKRAMAVFIGEYFTGLMVIVLYGIISISVNSKYLRTGLAGISGKGCLALYKIIIKNGIVIL